MAGSRRSSTDVGGTRLKASFVLLVGASGGSIALQGNASPATIGLSILFGILAGGLLLWYLTWIVGR